MKKKESGVLVIKSPAAIEALPPKEQKLTQLAARNVLKERELPKFQGGLPVNNVTGERDLAAIGALMEITKADDLNVAMSLVSAAAAGQLLQGDVDAEKRRALAQLVELQPEDHLQAMICSQMIATNSAISTTLYRAMLPDQTPYGKETNMNYATKLQRTFLQQVETLQKLRGKGQQTVEVKHVHIHDGGQAVIGPVTHSTTQGGEGAA